MLIYERILNLCNKLLHKFWGVAVMFCLLIERKGKSVNSFDTALQLAVSDMANRIFKDLYLLDFLSNIPSREIKIEKSLQYTFKSSS